MKVTEYKEFLFVFCLAVLQITHLSVTNVYNRLLGDSAVLTEVRRCFYYDFSGPVYDLYCILALYLICICICIRIFPALFDLYLDLDFSGPVFDIQICKGMSPI